MAPPRRVLRLRARTSINPAHWTRPFQFRLSTPLFPIQVSGLGFEISASRRGSHGGEHSVSPFLALLLITRLFRELVCRGISDPGAPARRFFFLSFSEPQSLGAQIIWSSASRISPVVVAKRRGTVARSERGKLERVWNWEIDMRDGCWL